MSSHLDKDLYQYVSTCLADSDTVEIIRRAVRQGVVLDTWMDGEEEENVCDEADALLAREEDRLTAEALKTGSVFPSSKMPERYVRSVFHELLFSTALYVAQKTKGHRRVELSEATEAVRRFDRFVSGESGGLTAAGRLFLTISSYEDLNALAFYGRMNREDFLLGTLHRPWSNLVLSAQLDVYRRAGLVDGLFTGEGDMIFLTDLGREVLNRLRFILEEAGEFKWRSESQRWVVFGEADYDKIFRRVFPDTDQSTREYLESLGLREGMRVLEIGCGTGRATVDLGLCDLVGPSGQVVALDPAQVLLEKLEAKCRDRGIQNVEVVRGVGEELPFLDQSFDAAIAVGSLHFTDAPKVVAEMARVTRPGGLVSAMVPPPEFDVREIPMVALWFRPLSDMAEHFGLPFGERNGLPEGVLEQAFKVNLVEVDISLVPGTVSTEDHQSFMGMVLRGAAIFQNILCRLPYQERRGIMRRLEEDGASIAAKTSPEEKRHVYHGQIAHGRVPS